MWKSDERRSKVGVAGEYVAVKFLSSKGHKVLSRNYRKKWGEIDVISKHNGSLHFVEVKTISREIKKSVSGENDSWRPEDNVHPEKIKRIQRTIESYLSQYGVSPETPWQIDVIAVQLEDEGKRAYVRYIQNVVL